MRPINGIYIAFVLWTTGSQSAGLFYSTKKKELHPFTVSTVPTAWVQYTNNHSEVTVCEFSPQPVVSPAAFCLWKEG